MREGGREGGREGVVPMRDEGGGEGGSTHKREAGHLANLSCLMNWTWWFLWQDLIQLTHIASFSELPQVKHLKVHNTSTTIWCVT